MLPGPVLIKKCSACGGLIEEETLVSGNTCGAVYWTDGEYYALMLPDAPRLVKCPFCRALLWLEELEVVGDDGRNRWDGFVPVVTPGLDLTTARPYRIPAANDYLRLLKVKTDSDEKELYLRLRAWRAGNDRRRRSELGPERFRKRKKAPLEPLSYAEIKNMKELICILDEQNDEDRLLKAELFRELGFFAQCLNILKKPLEEYRVAAAFIGELAGRQDPWVREMKEEEMSPGA